MDNRTGQRDFRDGFSQTLPLWMGVAPFGAAYALAARAAGLSTYETVGMSLLVYAGSAQFAAAALFAGGAGALAILVTTLLVNARAVLLSTSLAPALRRLSTLARAGVAFLIVDESYAMSVTRLLRGGDPSYLVGSGFSLYLAWLSGTAAGVALSIGVNGWGARGLDLVFPLSFFVLLLPYLRTRPARIAAAVAGALALGTRLMVPGSWYLPIAAIGGTLAGGVADLSAPTGEKQS